MFLFEIKILLKIVVIVDILDKIVIITAVLLIEIQEVFLRFASIIYVFN